MKRKTNIRWVVRITIISMFTSATFTFLSAQVLTGAGYILAFSVLLLFIAIGVLFDIIGVAVTSASEVPFHSMASHKERGAAEALALLRSAEKVASICNDVVGDISGIVSGTTAVIIVTNLSRKTDSHEVLLQLLISGLVAGFTIGGKAVGKALAINHSTAIVHFVGRLLRVMGLGSGKK
ncbi:MAG: hypothetical protein AB7C97_00385 [Oscillospiraceae bacterium]